MNKKILLGTLSSVVAVAAPVATVVSCQKTGASTPAKPAGDKSANSGKASAGVDAGKTDATPTL